MNDSIDQFKYILNTGWSDIINSYNSSSINEIPVLFGMITGDPYSVYKFVIPDGTSQINLNLSGDIVYCMGIETSKTYSLAWDSHGYIALMETEGCGITLSDTSSVGIGISFGQTSAPEIARLLGYSIQNGASCDIVNTETTLFRDDGEDPDVYSGSSLGVGASIAKFEIHSEMAYTDYIRINDNDLEFNIIDFIESKIMSNIPII